MSGNGQPDRVPTWQWLLSAAGCVLGLVGAMVILRIGSSAHTPQPSPDSIAAVEDPASIGTNARFTINGAVIEMRLPRMDWSIDPGGKIDSQIVNGAFEAEFNVTFMTGSVHMAYMGVEVRGGSVIVLRDGRVLLSTYAGEKPVTRMTSTPELFGPHQQHMELQFKADGTGPMRLRALWRPVDADEASLLPSESAVMRD